MDLIRKIILNLLAKGLSVSFVMIFHLFLARSLGVEQYGVYTLMQTICLGLAIYAQSGMQLAYLRFVSELKEQPDGGDLTYVTRFCLSRIVRRLFQAVIIYLLICLTLIEAGVAITITISISFFLFLCSQSFIFMLIAWYRAEDQSYISSFLEQGAYSIISLAFISVLFLGNIPIDVERVAVITAVSSLLVLFLGVIKPVFFLSILNGKVKSGNTSYFESVSNNILIMNLSSYILAWSGVWFAGYFLSSSDVAFLSVTQRFAQVIVFLLVSFNGVLAPRFSKLYTKGDFDSLRILAQKTAWLIVIFNMPVFCIMLYFGADLLSLFGDEFRSAYKILLILMFGQLVNILTGSVGFLLSMSGYEKIMRNTVIFSGLVTLALNLVLTIPFGLLGTSVSISIGLILNNLLLTFYVYKKLGFILIPGLQWVRRQSYG
jgi:O-antigen/teichoic acid export membrane protein